MSVQLSIGDSFHISRWMRRGSGFCMVLLGVIAGACLPAHAAGTSNVESTQTALQVTTSSTALGTKAAFAAHVAGLNGTALPTGVVTFESGATELGSAVVDAEGNAALTTGNLSPGTHQVVAVYRGDADNSASISPSVHVEATPTQQTGFTVTANPTSLTIPVGTFGSSTITVTPVDSFSAYVSLACNGLPAGAVCVFSPNYVLASCTGTGVTQSCPPVYSTMQIQTYAGNAKSTAPFFPGKRLPQYALIFPAVLGFAGLGARKRRAVWSVFAILVLFAGAISLTACSQRYNYLNHGPTPNAGTPTGSYTVTIDAVSTTGSEITKPLTPAQIAVTIAAPSS